MCKGDYTANCSHESLKAMKLNSTRALLMLANGGIAMNFFSFDRDIAFDLFP